jgi:hypothetical protein
MAIVSVFISGAAGPAGAKPVVLFDQAHGQRFLVQGTGPLDLSTLAGVFRNGGWTVRSSRAFLSAETLASVDGIVISGAFEPVGAREVEAVVQLLERGGRLCVMLHVGQPVDLLLYRLNVAIANGVVRERENVIGEDPVNFRVTRFEPHLLTRGLEEFSIYGGWALRNLDENAGIVARTGPKAWIDLNGDRLLGAGDAVQSFGVAVAGRLGQGQFALFGDDAIFQNQFLKGGNLTLARNLVAWLAPAAERRAAARLPRTSPGGQDLLSRR